MRKTKAQNGITLISLVITIIVLLILATVAISMAVDTNGLFARARKAAEDWNKSVGDESTAIENAMLIMNQIGGGSTPDAEGWDKEKIADVVEEGDRKAPIPEGFTASQVTGENTIENGLVIYETTETITDADVGSEDENDARRKYNQYVWIPVDDINSMVMCQQHPNSKLDTETALCTTCKKSTLLAGKLYTSIASGSTTPQLTFDANSGYREPANLTDSYLGDASVKGIAAIKGILEEAYPNKKGTYGDTYDSIKTDWLALQQKDFDEMAKSVAKYKGFYISRYEIQKDANKIGSKKNKEVMTGASNSGNMWYGLYDKIKNGGTQSSTVAQMIWGSQYDQVMMFVDGKNGYKVTESNDARHDYTEYKMSGNNLNDIACNIYDLEGNYYEWTAEANNTYHRVNRGRSSLCRR